MTYHTGDKEGGTDFRRAVCIDEVDWTADGQMVSTAHPTKAEKNAALHQRGSVRKGERHVH